MGELMAGKSSEALTLREACNKIIHLNKLDFSYKPLDLFDRKTREAAKGLRIAKPELTLSRLKNGKP